MMHALVIYESMFGNTRDVAQAIGEGLAEDVQVEVLEVGAAPSSIPDDVTLLVVGGPTHAFGMSRASTREDAASQSDGPLVSQGNGVREWLGSLERPDHEVAYASFDTHMDKPRVIAKLGSAATPIHRKLHGLGLHRTANAEHFWVSDTKGPLREGELDRAREWGRSLVADVRTPPVGGEDAAEPAGSSRVPRPAAKSRSGTPRRTGRSVGQPTRAVHHSREEPMTLVRFDLGGELDELRREVNQIFSTMPLLPTSMTEALGSARFIPAMDTFERDGKLCVSMDLPGIDLDDIDVEVLDDVLTIRGSRSVDRESSGDTWHRMERSSGSFERSLQLPRTIDPSEVDASFNQGVLTVTVPMPAEVQPQPEKVQIKAGS